jgi:hypothetical protein
MVMVVFAKEIDEGERQDDSISTAWCQQLSTMRGGVEKHRVGTWSMILSKR